MRYRTRGFLGNRNPNGGGITETPEHGLEASSEHLPACHDGAVTLTFIHFSKNDWQRVVLCTDVLCGSITKGDQQPACAIRNCGRLEVNDDFN